MIDYLFLNEHDDYFNLKKLLLLIRLINTTLTYKLLTAGDQDLHLKSILLL